jgi:2'-5' RNA ligase
MIRALAAAGNQYVYPPGDLHVTLLTLISAVEDFDPGPSLIDRYLECLSPLLEGESGFDIEFTGVSASPEAVYIKVFSEGRINRLRARLRENLQRRGLAGALDKRYRSETSHITILRFIDPVSDIEALTGAVEANGQATLGGARIGRIEFVENDWYMSSDKVRLLGAFALKEDGN